MKQVNDIALVCAALSLSLFFPFLCFHCPSKAMIFPSICFGCFFLSFYQLIKNKLQTLTLEKKQHSGRCKIEFKFHFFECFLFSRKFLIWNMKKMSYLGWCWRKWNKEKTCVKTFQLWRTWDFFEIFADANHKFEQFIFNFFNLLYLLSFHAAAKWSQKPLRTKIQK